MSETPEALPPEDIASLLRLGLEVDQETQLADPNGTILVAPPTPRGSSSGQSGGTSRGWSPPSVAELQKALPQYEISAFIARGGMGAVYNGTQKTLKRSVAIKVLPPEMEDGDLQFAARFKHEAQAMAQLSHPNIVAVFDAGEVVLGKTGNPEEEGMGRGVLLYFVMEFIEGTDVAQLIASEGIVEPRRAIQITSAVCEALAFAHEEGIIHRDIKPSNIMIDKRGRVKVADFGLAKTVKVEAALHTDTNLAMGTPDFIAPEALIPGVKLDQRADIYAVGVMLYQMLTGHVPRGRFTLPSRLSPHVDKGFDAVVDKAMQTDREKRYSTATEMKQDVERVTTPKASNRNTGTPGHTQRNIRFPLLISAAVIAVGSGAIFSLTRRGEQTAGGTIPPPLEHQVSAVTYPPGEWTKVLSRQEEWPEDWKRDGKVVQTGEWTKVAVRQLMYWHAPNGLVEKNHGIRATFQRTGVVGESALSVRAQTSEDGKLSRYRSIQGQHFKGLRGDARTTEQGNATLVAAVSWNRPPQDAMFTMTLIAIGSQLFVESDGRWFALSNDKLTDGTVRLDTDDSFRDVEVINLDGLSEAEALKAAGIPEISTQSLVHSPVSLPSATKDAPFINSLGMKFVPVPVTGGQTVIFSVWDTRVQDYEVFAQAMMRSWEKNSEVEQGASHPAVNVSWEDARDFCAWLTAREAKQGILAANLRYRLPSDHEWSCAVGIGDLEPRSKLPVEKGGMIAGVFPWGTQWPPPKGAGNYAGEELKAAMANGKFGNVKSTLTGYDDGFVNTSPVGSFPANKLGLYDMGGNVWQWCEDWLDGRRMHHVVRGGCWDNSDARQLLSSSRAAGAPQFRLSAFGFRCVLAVEPSTTPFTY